MITLFDVTGIMIAYGLVSMIAAALIGGVIGLVVGWISGSMIWWIIFCSITGAVIALLILIFLTIYAKQMGWQ